MTLEPETVLVGHPLALTALRWALATRTWLHHLELRAESDLDEVAGWLREAWQAAG